jgi:hypothetical protein
MHGSYSIGNNIDDFISTTKNSSLAWIIGYTCEIGEIVSTLIDVSILEHLLKLKKNDLKDRKKIIGAFTKALRRFNGDYPLCKGKGNKVLFKEAITLVVQPRGPKEKAQDETATLVVKLG